jgi:hypothetical protein
MRAFAINDLHVVHTSLVSTYDDVVIIISYEM